MTKIAKKVEIRFTRILYDRRAQSSNKACMPQLLTIPSAPSARFPTSAAVRRCGEPRKFATLESRSDDRPLAQRFNAWYKNRVKRPQRCRRRSAHPLITGRRSRVVAGLRFWDRSHPRFEVQANLRESQTHPYSPLPFSWGVQPRWIGTIPRSVSDLIQPVPQWR